MGPGGSGDGSMTRDPATIRGRARPVNVFESLGPGDADSVPVVHFPECARP